MGLGLNVMCLGLGTSLGPMTLDPDPTHRPIFILDLDPTHKPIIIFTKKKILRVFLLISLIYYALKYLNFEVCMFMCCKTYNIVICKT